MTMIVMVIMMTMVMRMIAIPGLPLLLPFYSRNDGDVFSVVQYLCANPKKVATNWTVDDEK